MTEKNAVERELAKLEEQWQAFMETDCAIFHWLIDRRDQQLAHTFVTLKAQFDEQEPDLFIPVQIPFRAKQTFALEMAQEVNRLVAEGIADSASESLPETTWQLPDLAFSQSGFHALFLSCQALLDAFGDVLSHLVLAITPTEVTHLSEYHQWWDTVCRVKAQYRDWPNSLRMVVFDCASEPMLTGVFAPHPALVFSRTANVDLSSAIKTIAQEADDGTDGAKVRLHLLDMNEAIAAGDLQQLERASALALPIAEHNQWLDVHATLFMTRAAGYLNTKVYKEALQDYRQAQNVAEQGAARKIPGCDKLLLQAMLCEGTVLFLAERLGDAARAYERAALRAQELKDSWMALEAWRMASFSLEREGNSKHAWHYANEAFKVGREMSQEQREQSTLPFVGQALLRISPNAQVHKEVKAAFNQWLGEDWLEQLENTVP